MFSDPSLTLSDIYLALSSSNVNILITLLLFTGFENYANPSDNSSCNLFFELNNGFFDTTST